MKRITLFSKLTDSNRKPILGQIVPAELLVKTIAYIPSDGVVTGYDHIRQWEEIAQEYGAKLNVIDNRTRSVEEQEKILASNILVLSGGNTFKLLHNLRRSGLDDAIMKFVDKPDFVLSGFSAGALVLTPNIKVCTLPDFDENLIGLKDLDALNTVDFEIFPHYDEAKHGMIVSDYRKTTANRVCEITDEDYIVLDL